MNCSLCRSTFPNHPIIDDKLVFCCHGCHAVFQILSAKGALENVYESPIFKQALQAGLISNPKLLAELKEKQDRTDASLKEKLYLEIDEMWCPSCAELIRLVLLQEKGVVNCSVDYSTDLAVIEFSPLITSKESIINRISSLGYLPHSLESSEKKRVSYALYLRFIIAAFCSLNVMMFAYPLYATYFDFDDQGYGLLFSWLSLCVSLPVVTYCAWPIFRRAGSAMLVGILGMEALVSIGVLSAFVFSLRELIKGGTQVYFDSMTVVVVFVLLGKIIESKAKFSAKSSIIRLHKSIPKKGRKKMLDGSWSFVPVKDIPLGSIVRVLMGEKIVLDGIVVKGSGACNESLMTGESLPLLKKEGSRVLAGSILQSGTLEIEVASIFTETSLHRILQLVENDMNHKTSYVRAVDVWVKAFVPFVLVFAVVVFLASLPFGSDVAVTRMMAVLLISCPCAIGIAAPLAESHFMHALTNLGAVVQNRRVLSDLGRVTAYVFDKTGTITKGVFEVSSGLNELSEENKQILSCMTASSMHPISQAISANLKIAEIDVGLVEEVIGKGLRCEWNGKRYWLGSRSFANEFLSDNNKKTTLEIEGINTTLFFGCDQALISTITLGDQIRSEATFVINKLQSFKRILLSGDSKNVVEAVSKQCGFSEWFAEASPLKKRAVVEFLKDEGEVVCVIGDGINDAPSLTVANVGISVLTAADISIQVSDILLTKNNLSVIPEMGALAKKAQRIIKQNLFWAFFYNVVGIGLAAGGLLSPIFAAAAMMVSSLMVLFNAQRLSGGNIVELNDPGATS